VNAITLGVGGNLVKAFAQVTSSVVDFGDVLHIQEQIEMCIQHPDGTAEIVMGVVESTGDPGEILKKQFLQGIELVKNNILDADLDKLIKDGNAMAMIAATAGIAGSPEMLDEFESVHAANQSEEAAIQSEDAAKQTVDVSSWFVNRIEGISKFEAKRYACILVSNGFDSEEIINEVLHPEHLDTMEMKLAHKLLLMRSLKSEGHPNFLD
jgi:hypothetical protein